MDVDNQTSDFSNIWDSHYLRSGLVSILPENFKLTPEVCCDMLQPRSTHQTKTIIDHRTTAI